MVSGPWRGRLDEAGADEILDGCPRHLGARQRSEHVGVAFGAEPSLQRELDVARASATSHGPIAEGAVPMTSDERVGSRSISSNQSSSAAIARIVARTGTRATDRALGIRRHNGAAGPGAGGAP